MGFLAVNLALIIHREDSQLWKYQPAKSGRL